MERGSTFSRAAAAVILLLSLLVSCGQSQESRWQEQYDLGMRYLSQGNYQEAVIAFTAAIEIDPKRAEALIGRGDAYVLLGETEDNLSAALADYQAALELDETLVSAWLGLADVYVLQGDYDRALEILQEALEKTGQDPDIQDRLNRLEEETGSPQALFEAFLEQEGYSELQDSWIYGVPSEYALLDVNGDGWEELILSGGNGTGFYNFAVFYLDRESGEIIPAFIGNPSSGAGTVGQYYGGITYSPVNHALVYTELNNGAMFGGVGFHILLDTGAVVSIFSYGFETNPQTMERSYTFLDAGGNATTISQNEYQQAVAEPEGIEFKTIPSHNGGQSSGMGEGDLSSLLGRNIFEVATEIPGMTNSDYTGGSTGFHNDFLIVSSDYDSEEITFISLDGESDFTLWDLSFGMDRETARSVVLQSGWIIRSETDNRIQFEREDGSQLSVYAQDGRTVDGISLFAS